MTQSTDSSAAAGSFAQHVREFHRGLPNEEKQMLEQIFMLAEAASMALSAEGEDVKGYALADYFQKIQGPAAKYVGEPVAYKILPPVVTYFHEGALKLT